MREPSKYMKALAHQSHAPPMTHMRLMQGELWGGDWRVWRLPLASTVQLAYTEETPKVTSDCWTETSKLDASTVTCCQIDAAAVQLVASNA